MIGTYWYEFHPLHLSSIVRWWNSKHQPCRITVGYYQRKWYQIYLSFIEMFSRVMCLIFTYFTMNVMLLTSSVTSIIIHLMQTSSYFEQDIVDAVIDRWHDRLRSLVHADGTLQAHALKWIFIYVVHQNIFILSLTFGALKDEVVFTWIL